MHLVHGEGSLERDPILFPFESDEPPMRLLCVFLFAWFGVASAESVSNWTAKFAPCEHHEDLLTHGPMSIGVRFATSNPELAAQFRLALDFWSKVLDLEWHEDNSRTCSLEIADGKRELFEPEIDTMAARSQFPDRRAFQGWIAFNPAITLSKTELYRISVHEIGHVLGLHHNLDVRSLMYSLDLDCSDSLDAEDLKTLAIHHKLRTPSITETVKLTAFP